MARLRLFAGLRELAGTAATDIDGETVSAVLAAATVRFGDDFGRALGSAQVWVDGDKADAATPVAAGAEVALIPPVSGGALVVQSPVMMEIGLVLAFAAALFICNELSLQWFAVATVAVGGIWAFDLVASADRRGLPIGQAPVLLAVFAGAIATYRFGAPGMAGATAGAVLVAFLWSIIQPGLRSVDSFAAGITLAALAAFGSSSLVLLRLRSRDETIVFVFVMTVAVVVAWFSDRTEGTLVDPLIALIVSGVLAGAVGAAFWAPDLVAAMAGAVAAAIALVAGRNLGTLVRAGGFFVQGPIPGSLSYFDGAFVAAGAFWAILTILT